jgi:hypothetical protein
MDHGRFGPQGALGGADGGVNRVEVIRGGEVWVPPHLSKAQDIALLGDRVPATGCGGEVRTPGRAAATATGLTGSESGSAQPGYEPPPQKRRKTEKRGGTPANNGSSDSG